MIAAAGFPVLLTVVTLTYLAAGRHTQVEAVQFGVFVVGALLMSGIGLYESGPNRIDFDLTQRTYIYERGFPFKPVRRCGTFAEFDTLKVRERRGRYTVYEVVLEWRSSRHAAFRLASEESERAGRRRAQELSAALGLPVSEG